jgi:hypothetical protein
MEIKKINWEKINAGLELLIKIDKENEFIKEMNMMDFEFILPIIQKQIADTCKKQDLMNKKKIKICVDAFETFARNRVKKLDLTDHIRYDRWNELFNDWAHKHLNLCILASNITITYS